MVTYNELVDKYNELDKDAGKYNRPEFNKVYAIIAELVKDRDDVGDKGNFGFPLVTGAIIDEALDKAGYSNDKAFVSDFKKYREIEQEARDVQLQGFSLKDSPINQALQATTKKWSNTDGWQFVNIAIIAPADIIDTIDKSLECDLRKAKGLYQNITEIPTEDEDDDDFFMIEAYGIKCSFEPYYRELQDYKVIEALFNDKGNKDIFLSTLKMLATFIKNNTAAPNKIRNKINDIITGLDKIPAIGLIWQILLLQGLCKWMESIDIDEDNGLNEAQSLYDWIWKRLAEKEINFCYFFWSEGDKEKLKPLCNYLYSTDVGKLVQEKIFKKEQSEQETISQQDKKHIKNKEYSLDREKLLDYLIEAWKRENDRENERMLISDIEKVLTSGNGKKITAIASIIYTSDFMSKAFKPNTFSGWFDSFIAICGIDCTKYPPSKVKKEITELETTLYYLKKSSF